jgi:hypothetical protein
MSLRVLLVLLAATGGASQDSPSCDNNLELMARAAGLQSTCCPGGPTSCPLSIPTYCSSDCSNALLEFVADCNALFMAAGLGPAIEPVVAVCEAAPTGAGGSAEVGGSAMDHFGDDELASCTNVASGQPATQSSDGWGGVASRAVDGAGLDGSFGSNSCSHTMDTGPQWWQVDLGTSQQEVRAIQLVNRADCCQDRLVGARVIVSSTSDYTAREGRTNCGSVTQAESEAGAESVIIKTCDPGTAGRYVTVAAVPDTFLALCEVAVFADCSTGGSGKASSLGANCHYSISGASGDGLNRADAEAACIANGGHLASVHSDADVDAIAALQPNGAWLGLSDLDSECGCDGDCFLWSDGTPNDYNNWGAGEPNDWQNGQSNCDGGAAGIGSVGNDDGGEDCVHVRGDNKWNEAGCGGNRKYVCRTCQHPGGSGH